MGLGAPSLGALDPDSCKYSAFLVDVSIEHRTPWVFPASVQKQIPLLGHLQRTCLLSGPQASICGDQGQF